MGEVPEYGSHSTSQYRQNEKMSWQVLQEFFFFSFFFIGIGVPDVTSAPSERAFLEGAVSKGH